MRFAKHVRLMPTYAWIATTSLIVILPLLLIIGLAYINGYVDGTAHANRDMASGARTNECQRLAHQVNWAKNVEDARLKAHQITQAQWNDVMSAEIAAYAYSCGPWPYPAGDIYMPGAVASPIPTNSKPTIPVAPHAVKPRCSLAAAHCPAEGY